MLFITKPNRQLVPGIIIYSQHNAVTCPVAQQRIIAHFDLDAFFVSVECLKDPGLKGKPLLVGGHSDRGVVAACSYEARKYGIHSAMPMRQAKQLCPHALVVGGSRSDYGRFSRYVTEIIAAKAPLFEKASIDEFYIDLTGMDKYHDPFAWTRQLRQEIIDKTMLPISFGLSSNKMVAKMATNEAKPNGYLFIPFGREKDFLAPLAVDKIPGVGEATCKYLNQLGIHTIADLAARTEKELENELGKTGSDLWRRAHGIHDSAVVAYHEAKSISSENTFEADTNDVPFLLGELARLTEKIGHELRDDGKLASCVTVKIRYENFDTTSKQTSISPTDYDHVFIPQARELFHQLYQKGRKVRLIGVRFSNFSTAQYQGNLFTDTAAMNKLYKAIDTVKDSFGKNILKRGSSG
jgi:DNA polymerase IV